MHHDPRGGQPTRSGAEDRFGIYESIDTPVAVMTFGYCGLFSYSTYNGTLIPFVSVGLEYLYRELFGQSGGVSAREWMRRSTVTDQAAYGAEPMLQEINLHLINRSGTTSPIGVSELFFAHNNYFLETSWLRDPASRWLFRTPGAIPFEEHQRPAVEWLLMPFATKDAKEPPRWAKEMRLSPERNANAVRLDDVSDTFWDDVHGFSVVTVYPGGANRHEYVSLPATNKRLFK
jgi:hypothetical protein